MLYGRAGSADASACVPARTQQPWARAIAANGAVVGPGTGGRGPVPGGRPAVLHVLRQDDEVRVHRRLAGHRRGTPEVVVDVVARLELHERDPQRPHDPMVRA